jgi:hypothetical protein
VDDVFGAIDGPVHAGLLGALGDDSLNNQWGLEGSDVVAGQGYCAGTQRRGDDLAEVIAAAAQVLGLHQAGEGVLAAEGGRVSRLQTE